MTGASQQIGCFIGSSAEGLPYAAVLAELLTEHGIDCEQWDLDTFALGQTTMEGLEAALARNSFAVLVATADDRVVSRRRAKIGPRDNVVFEFGMFVGKLGRARAFLLVPEDVGNLKLPSDLLGVTLKTFVVRRTTSARKNGMRDAAAAVVAAVGREGPLVTPTDPAVANELLSLVSGLVGDLRTAAVVEMDEGQRDGWAQSVLAGVLDPFLARSEDAYSVWLRPGADGSVLRVVQSANLDGAEAAHEWRKGEGLVGRVWETASAKAVDRLKGHSWFVSRPGCENETYLCVPVAGAGGAEGVLAVGSDAGFDVRAGDLGLLHVHAKLLALAMP